MCSSVPGAKALKKLVCDLSYSISVKSLRNRIKKIWTLHVKAKFVFRLFNVFLRSRDQSAKETCPFVGVLAFYSVRFKWNKMIRENSAKYVNQTGNFYFRPKLKTAISLPIFNIFENFVLDESSCLDLYINLKIKISTKWSVWGYTVTLSYLWRALNGTGLPWIQSWSTVSSM